MNFGQIAGLVLGASPADQTEVFALEQHESLTRFANNSIHQNVTEANCQVTVRAVIGTKAGIAISNNTAPDSLHRLARRAYEVALLQPDNPEFKGLPRPETIEPVAAFDEAAASCSPDERAQRAGVICRKAADAGCSAAGSITTMTTAMGVANSHGVFAGHRATLADASTVIMGTSSSGWSQMTGWTLDAIDTEAMAGEALRKVRIGVDPVDFEPGEYTVVLDPYAVADLLEMLAYDGMSALAVQEGRSWLNGRAGERIMADSVTIADDGLDPRGIPQPFDFEGMPKNAVPIVESGIAMGPVYDTFTAGREPGKATTGHATPPSPFGRIGPAPMNLFLRPRAETIDSMIRSTKLGLYITRFWYTRIVHPRDAVVTGMTRDGTFVIRDGEIAHPVKSMRFTQSYVEALKHTEAIGSRVHVLRGSFGATCVPAIKLAKFRFTSSTR
jgi:PmbA protein